MRSSRDSQSRLGSASTSLGKSASLLLAVLGASCTAQVITDGTVGSAPGQAVGGPNFEIGAELGHKAGANLFHSFRQFDIPMGAIATFSGPDSVANILARVTGDQASNIEGTLRSTIKDAKLFLMNPKGIVFGPGARLDLQGSFAATTAHSIRLADGSSFTATPTPGCTLSAAAPAAFGFDGPSGGIEIRANKVPKIEATLEVLPGRELQLVGDHVTLKDGAAVKAPGGTALVVAQGGRGNVPVSGLPSVPENSLALVHVAGGSKIVTTAEPGAGPPGRLVIRGGKLLLENSESFIQNDSKTTAGGAVTDIAVSGDVVVSDAAYISSKALHAAGPGGTLTIAAQGLELKTQGFITVDSGMGSGGDGTAVNIQSPSVHLTDGFLNAESLEGTAGAGPKVTIVASDSFTVSGSSGSAYIAMNSRGTPSEPAKLIIETGDFSMTGEVQPEIRATTSSTTQGGDIVIKANVIRLNGNSRIQVDTFGPGPAGTISLSADDVSISDSSAIRARSGSDEFQTPPDTGAAGTIEIYGRQPDTAAKRVAVTGHALAEPSISTQSFSRLQTAEASSITIWAMEVAIDNGVVTTQTKDAPGGQIVFQAQKLTVNGSINSSTDGSGNAGSIRITADDIEVAGGRIGSFAEGAKGTTANAGSISISANRSFVLHQGGGISVGSEGGTAGTIEIRSAGNLEIEGPPHGESPAGGTLASSGVRGGDIRLSADGLVLLRDLTINAQATGAGNMDSGGTIEIPAAGPEGIWPQTPLPRAVVLDSVTLNASAVGGSGGIVRIATPGYVQSADTTLNTSSVNGTSTPPVTPRLEFQPPIEPPQFQLTYNAPLEWQEPSAWETSDPEGYTRVGSRPSGDGGGRRRIQLGP